MVVSHSRGMTAELSLSRPHLLAIYRRLQAAGYAVLVSNDAGPTTWGAPQALTYLGDMHSRATRAFPFNGRTYNFGYSMGGLPALLTASLGVYPVSGVILLDAQVSLQDVWRSGRGNPTFVADIAAAHGLTRGETPPPERDPWTRARGTWAALPLLVAGGAGDTVVSFARNGEALFAQSSAQGSQLLRLEGPHLGGSHFGDALLEPMLAFLGRLESAQARAPKPLVPVPDPAAPAPAPTDATE
ncbi:alpha/beta hydrolase [Deinococcus koreensis]|uniref:Alpha/beta hydrolase n=1 Tax=Deinococcus koreensis TaxID=2054903 RepID=A0A2K3UWS7_9DEIO|nr:alpha/beta hydrolase [Deinococcus koreensis]